MLQPLDVGINKPFKDHLQYKWQQWMISGDHTFTTSGCTCKAELNAICGWIKEAWDDIPAKMIQRSCRKCCITNAIDGTEDNAVWRDDEEDLFDDLEEGNADELFYVNNFEHEQAEIDAETYDQLFGDSDEIRRFRQGRLH